MTPSVRWNVPGGRCALEGIIRIFDLVFKSVSVSTFWLKLDDVVL